jgi:SAM-dependent methyltransferase
MISRAIQASGDGLLDQVVCARCAASLDVRAASVACARCLERYPRVGRLPVLLPRAEAHVALWRQQLDLLATQGRHTQAALDETLAAELAMPSSLPESQARLRRLAQGVREQLEDLSRWLEPALGGALPATEGVGLPRGVVEHLHFLYRDWGWDGGAHRENERAVEAIREVQSAGPFGRTLVLGAGACRLAYDLHRSCGATETAVVDIDPFLFVMAEAVVRGNAVRLTEATPSVQESEHVAATWTLRAPHGPLAEGRFHFFLADGLAPPFAAGAFDTIVTPWFIDQVPTDLPAFLGTVGRLLRPGGRWINQGPLLYPVEAPMSRRFSREEVFALANGAGFEITCSSSESVPHLVSPLTGRGKIERVLTFEARRAPGGAA